MFHVKRPIRAQEARFGPARRPILHPFKREARNAPGKQPIHLLSAVLALATGVVHASLAPLLAMGDLRPNLILAAVVAVTVLAGLGAGATWAFIGGLTANLLTTDALGTIPLGLLLVAGLVTLLGRALGRRAAMLALVGGVLGSAVLDLLGVGVLVLADGGSLPGVGDLLVIVVPSAALNGLLAVALFLAARAVMNRIGLEPPASWA
jgi:hypothetical protein